MRQFCECGTDNFHVCASCLSEYYSHTTLRANSSERILLSKDSRGSQILVVCSAQAVDFSNGTNTISGAAANNNLKSFGNSCSAQSNFLPLALPPPPRSQPLMSDQNETAWPPGAPVAAGGLPVS